MKIVVLGASGMLGSMLVDYLSKYYEVVATVRKSEYIKEVKSVQWCKFDAEQIEPLDPLIDIVDGSDYVINAIGAIPQKSYDSDLMYRINSKLPMALADLSLFLGFRLIEPLTDCVFSGETGNYDERSKSNNNDIYGLTKSLGECKGRNIINLRCSLIGPEPYGNYSLLGWFLSQPENAIIQGYTNHLWNGITTLNFAKICRGIIENNISFRNTQHIIPFNGVNKFKLLNHFKNVFDRQDVIIHPAAQKKNVNRLLTTVYPGANGLLWKFAGYEEIPSIEIMIQELAEYVNENTYSRRNPTRNNKAISHYTQIG